MKTSISSATSWMRSSGVKISPALIAFCKNESIVRIFSHQRGLHTLSTRVTRRGSNTGDFLRKGHLPEMVLIRCWKCPTARGDARRLFLQHRAFGLGAGFGRLAAGFGQAVATCSYRFRSTGRSICWVSSRSGRKGIFTSPDSMASIRPKSETTHGKASRDHSPSPSDRKAWR